MTSILVVCTANTCRSPMAEAFLRREAARRGVEAEVGSAGIAADGGDPPQGGSVRALARLGLDIAPHRSRGASHRVVDAADLVLTMEVAHLRELVADDPAHFPRTFTLREIVRRARVAGPRGEATLAEWLAALGTGRRAADLLGATDLDVVDPIGRPDAEYQRCAAEIEELCGALAGFLWGPVPGT